MVKRGLYIGRFNPLHLGHIEAISSIISKNEEIDQLIIGIGSAQESFTLKNPFTAGERFEMLLDSLVECNLDREKYFIIPLLDLNNNNQWIAYIRSLLPEFKFIYSNNPLVRLLSEKNGINVRSIQLINRDLFSSTIVRHKMIKEDETWIQLVPKPVYSIIKNINGIKRIKTLSSTDSVTRPV